MPYIFLSPKFVCRLESEVCTHPSCKRKVVIGLPLCWQHSRKILGVGIKTHPTFGKGLYAFKDFSRGDVICPYGGRPVTDSNLDSMYDGHAPYALTDDKHGKNTDAACKRGVGSMANGASTKKESNASSHYQSLVNPITGKEEETFYLVATKRIQKGDEIVHHYGTDYFSRKIDKHSNTHYITPKQNKTPHLLQKKVDSLPEPDFFIPSPTKQDAKSTTYPPILIWPNLFEDKDVSQSPHSKVGSRQVSLLDMIHKAEKQQPAGRYSKEYKWRPDGRLDLTLSSSWQSDILSQQTPTPLSTLIQGATSILTSFQSSYPQCKKATYEWHLMYVPPGAKGQQDHMDHHKKKCYYTFILPLTEDEAGMGTDIVLPGEKETKREIVNVYRGMYGFSGDVVHRGTGNPTSKVRIFLYAALFTGTDHN